ncbi:hypothetical protein K466DRAFT_391390 [Polyporus arcularius HHB13444]|uniref:Uncharacterized protein n=1 Tax=Polyporus arcularius HHB13444 TaxID=1314778 RepID=A0A5C3NTR4_9APHY|nr:hypothetical protein K466DRAFT_391390 [Polyporus arcularius HHB13444]
MNFRSTLPLLKSTHSDSVNSSLKTYRSAHFMWPLSKTLLSYPRSATVLFTLLLVLSTTRPSVLRPTITAVCCTSCSQRASDSASYTVS